MPDFLRFHRLGFSCNPFRVLTNEEWATLALVPTHILDIIEDTDHHVQLIGEIGRGKTTLLLGVFRHLQQQHRDVKYEYIPEGQRNFKTRPLPVNFLLDEAQRLIWWERRRLFAQLQGGIRLVFSTHRDFRRAFKGLQMGLAVIDVNSLYDTESLYKMWQRRLDYFRTRESDICLTMDGSEYLLQTFGNDRRSMERFLYEAFQALEGPQPLDQTYLSRFRMSFRPGEV